MSKYTEAVDKQTAGTEHVNPGPCPGCKDCGLEDCKDMNTPEYEAAGEGGFSWHDCEICGSPLGGHRSPFHGFIDKEIVHLEGCNDCAAYLANGDEPEHWEG